MTSDTRSVTADELRDLLESLAAEGSIVLTVEVVGEQTDKYTVKTAEEARTAGGLKN